MPKCTKGNKEKIKNLRAPDRPDTRPSERQRPQEGCRSGAPANSLQPPVARLLEGRVAGRAGLRPQNSLGLSSPFVYIF